MLRASKCKAAAKQPVFFNVIKPMADLKLDSLKVYVQSHMEPKIRYLRISVDLTWSGTVESSGPVEARTASAVASIHLDLPMLVFEPCLEILISVSVSQQGRRQ